MTNIDQARKLVNTIADGRHARTILRNAYYNAEDKTLAATNGYRLMVLDLSLPEESGLINRDSLVGALDLKDAIDEKEQGRYPDLQKIKPNPVYSVEFSLGMFKKSVELMRARIKYELEAYKLGMPGNKFFNIRLTFKRNTLLLSLGLTYGVSSLPRFEFVEELSDYKKREELREKCMDELHIPCRIVQGDWADHSIMLSLLNLMSVLSFFSASHPIRIDIPGSDDAPSALAAHGLSQGGNWGLVMPLKE